MSLNSKKWLERLIYVITVFAVVCCIMFTNCGDDATTDSSDDGMNVIGPNGGTITDPSGVTIDIPAGALATNTEITIEYFEDQSELPDSIRSSLLNQVGTCRFEPDGLEFDSVVTITIPSNQTLTAGEKFPLWVWNETSQAWEMTEFICTASADGSSFSAEITHFSTLSGDNGWGSDGIFGDLEPANWLEVMQAFQDWYSNFMFQVRNLGYKAQVGDCCMEVTGLKFSIDYQGDPPYRNDVDFGNLADYSRTEKFEVTRAALHLVATIYWSGKPPTGMIVETSTAYIDLMEGDREATITAKPVCDGTTMPGVAVNFTLDGPGSISPTSGTTDGAGEVTTTYTASDTGHVTITGKATTCQAEGEAQYAEEQVEIEVDSCTQWELFVKIEFTHYTENWNFQDLIIMYVPIEISDGTLYGENGEGSHYATLESTNDHCSVSNNSTPDFTAGAIGSATENELTVSIAPMGGFLVNYTFTCEYDDGPYDVPLPPYSFLLQAIMAGQAFDDLKIPYEKGAQVLGGGVDENGGDNPISYEFEVILHCN